MTGFYLMHRGWLDHPALGGAREPFCRRAAWAWIIENACYAETKVGIGKKTVTLSRGQFSHSLRYMAGAWGWDDPKVRRFLARLVEEKMIECVTDAGQTIVTVCNYEEYQVPGRVTDAPTDAGATQERRSGDANKNEGNQGKEGSGEADASPGAGGAAPVPSLPVISPERIIWGQCLDWLAQASDKPRDRLRGLMGQWVRDYGKAAVLQVIQSASRAPPVGDPVPWIIETLAREADRNAQRDRQEHHERPGNGWLSVGRAAAGPG